MTPWQTREEKNAYQREWARKKRLDPVWREKDNARRRKHTPEERAKIEAARRRRYIEKLGASDNYKGNAGWDKTPWRTERHVPWSSKRHTAEELREIREDAIRNRHRWLKATGRVR